VFENRVLRKIFGLQRDEVTGNGENCLMRRLIKFRSTLHQILLLLLFQNWD
jgi:hypothetical protein